MNPSSTVTNRFTVFTLISILLLLIYWNSFRATWQFDDRANIVDNPGLRISDLKVDSLWGSFFANQGKTPALFRPLPCLSFALNWYIGKDDPFGYHLVNLACHILTAWILYLLMIQLLKILEGYKNNKLATAPEAMSLLAAVLWAVNPIQTQAVTYIVQRMAMMAALFYLLGMYAYIKARLSQTLTGRCIFASICLLCFLGGIGSKENAILMPVSLILMEWIFFQKGSLAYFFRPKILLAGTIVVIVIAVIIYLTASPFLDHIMKGYEVRPFTLMERVLTQPRIVLGYLSQIFFPLPERLSLVHDVTLSKSLLHPWTTLPAIIFILVATIGAVVYAKRYPLISFAVLFYFLNHTVESSIWPLELIYEHRNYLPSAFLMLPVAAGFCTVLNKLQKFGIAHALWVAIMIGVIMALGVFTHERNKAWATKESLWRDALLKAPGNIRPFVFLGIELGWRQHATPADLRHAMALFKHSLKLTLFHKFDYAKIMGNIAWIYYFQGEDKMAIQAFHQAITKVPEIRKNRMDMISPLMRLGRFDEAKEQADFLLEKSPDNPKHLNILGVIFLWQEKYKESLTCFQSAMKQEPNNENSNLYIGVALTRMGYFQRGFWFLNQAVRHSPRNPLQMLALIENRVRAGDIDKANSVARKLVDIASAPQIIALLNALPQYPSVPVASNLVTPVVYSVMTEVLENASAASK